MDYGPGLGPVPPGKYHCSMSGRRCLSPSSWAAFLNPCREHLTAERATISAPLTAKSQWSGPTLPTTTLHWCLGSAADDVHILTIGISGGRVYTIVTHGYQLFDVFLYIVTMIKP